MKYHNQTLGPTHGCVRKSQKPLTVTRHHESNQSEATTSLPHQYDCESRKDSKYYIIKEGPNTGPPQTLGAISTINGKWDIKHIISLIFQLVN